MNKREQMDMYDNAEFWSRVIKEAKKQAAPVEVVHTYRPIGILVAISFLTFIVLIDHGVPMIMALLITALVAIMVIRFS